MIGDLITRMIAAGAEGDGGSGDVVGVKGLRLGRSGQRV
jgi:hypothetical protein